MKFTNAQARHKFPSEFFLERRKIYIFGAINRLVGGAVDIVTKTYEKVVLDVGGNLVNKIINGTNDLARGVLDMSGKAIAKGAEWTVKGVEEGGRVLGRVGEFGAGHISTPTNLPGKILQYPFNTADRAVQGLTYANDNAVQTGKSLAWDWMMDNVDSLNSVPVNIGRGAQEEWSNILGTARTQRMKLKKLFSHEGGFNIFKRARQVIDVALSPIPLVMQSAISTTRFGVKHVLGNIAKGWLDVVVVNPVRMMNKTLRGAVETTKGVGQVIASPVAPILSAASTPRAQVPRLSVANDNAKTTAAHPPKKEEHPPTVGNGKKADKNHKGKKTEEDPHHEKEAA